MNNTDTPIIIDKTQLFLDPKAKEETISKLLKKIETEGPPLYIQIKELFPSGAKLGEPFPVFSKNAIIALFDW